MAEWYPSRREPKRSTLIGVGRLARKSLGRLGPNSGWFDRVTRIKLCYWVTAIALKTKMFVGIPRITFAILMKVKTIALGYKIWLGFY